MQMNMVKLPTKQADLYLRTVKGHFATNHSHINYYIDVTMQKARLSEAKAVAQALVANYRSNTVIDSILCLDGTEVIATCLAEYLTKDDFINMTRPSMSSPRNTRPAASSYCGTISSPWSSTNTYWCWPLP